MTVTCHDLNKGWNSLAAEMLYASMSVPPEESLFSGPKEEIDFYERCIRCNGGFALDHACGTGRHLFPLIRRGLQVDGSDSSADAIGFAQSVLKQTGLKSRLYNQRMENFESAVRYGTIYIANGTFSVFYERRDAFECLARIRKHLVPGGQLLLESFVPDAMKGIRNYEVDDKPLNWDPIQCRSIDGEISAELWTVSMDALEQTMVEKRRYSLHVGGKVVRTEEHILKMRWFHKWELVMMLEKTGFQDIQLYSDYKEQSPTTESKVIIYSARSPAA
jgi:SAM-dependent methyltransferase